MQATSSLHPLVKLPLRLAFLVGLGWVVDRFFHTGWLLAVCLLSVVDRELWEFVER